MEKFKTSGTFDRIFFVLTLLICVSLPLSYLLTNADFRPAALIFFGLFGILLVELITEYTGKLEFFFLFIIIALSFHGFSSFPGSNFTEVNNYIILGVLYSLLSVIYLFDADKRKISPGLSSLDKLLLLAAFIFFIVSVLYNSQDLMTLKGAGKLAVIFFGGFVVSGFLSGVLLKDRNTLDIFLKGLVYFGIAAGLYGFATMVNHSLNSFNQYPGYAISFFKHPNATSSIYNFTIPPALYFLIFRKQDVSAIEKVIFGFGIFLMTFNVLFTFSRIGILSVALIFIIMMFGYSRKVFYAMLAIIPGLIYFVLLGFLTSKGASTAIGRVGLLATTIEMFTSSSNGQMWGYGTTSTIEIFERTKYSLKVTDLNNVPHNFIMYFILQFGLFVTVPLFLFIFRIFGKAASRIFKMTGDPVLVMSAAVCYSIVSKNMFEDLLFFPEFILFHLFLIFFGFMIFLTGKNAPEYSSDFYLKHEPTELRA